MQKNKAHLGNTKKACTEEFKKQNTGHLSASPKIQ